MRALLRAIWVEAAAERCANRPRSNSIPMGQLRLLSKFQQRDTSLREQGPGSIFAFFNSLIASRVATPSAVRNRFLVGTFTRLTVSNSGRD